ncbi:MAG: hypothetical protein ACFE95_12350 [Candidatus Hodarchaeota archaeon]
MDFSKQYIKMCRQAKCFISMDKAYEDGSHIFIKHNFEIAGTRGFEWLRMFGSGKKAECWARDFWTSDNPEMFDECDWVWLLKQDQLWSFVDEYKGKVHRIFRFYSFLKKKYLDSSNQDAYIIINNMFGSASMEELLLCFVMMENFRVIWDHKLQDWVAKG